MALDGTIFRPITEDATSSADVLSMVLASSTDITLSIRRDGVIKAVVLNPHAAFEKTPNSWVGQDIKSVLTTESQDKLLPLLELDEDTDISEFSARGPMELNHVDETGFERPVRYSLVFVESDNSILMLGRDLSAIAKAQQALIKTQAALENDTRAQRERNALFSMLKSETKDPLVFVGAGSGKITDITASAAKLFGEKPDVIVGKKLANFVADADQALLTQHVLSTDQADEKQHKVNLTTGDTAVVSTGVYRTARETVLLCRFEAEEQTRETRSDWQSLAKEAPDALAIVDKKGAILAVNPSFLAVSQKGHADSLVGQAISDHLGRGQVDWGVIKNTVDDLGLVRHYQSHLQTHYGDMVPVSIAATQIGENGSKRYGLAIRELSSDVSQDEPVIQDPESVSELVGKASLKDIVSQTTEIIEKICIETAIKMTKNNRFAAAEMLNLSRQSLYVKLRKYGLIDKQDDE